MSIKLLLDVGNDECIILWDFGDLIVRGVEVIARGEGWAVAAS